MPFVVTDNDVQSTRKRRRDDDDHGSIHRLYEQDRHQDHYLLNAVQDFGPSRRVLPLSSKPKRARITSSSEDENSNIHCLSRDGFATAAHRRRPSQQKIPPDQQPNINVGGKTPFRPTAAVSAPCYICHRRPTKKSDLDSFAQCEGCGEVACFVCVRLCHGWNADDGMSMLSRSFPMGDADDMGDADGEPQHHEGHLRRYTEGANGEKQEDEARRWGKGWAASRHRSVVCSRCCVERGRDGEVVCLGCLSGMPGA